jgi:2-haloacid dehalogenase
MANFRALTFDIIGTVFDWRSTFTDEVASLNGRYGLDFDPAAFALGAHRGYASGVQTVRGGGPWKTPDEILRQSIVDLLSVKHTPSAEEVDDFVAVWRRLRPWPEVPQALNALHERYTLAILSNVSVAVQSALTKHSSLPFDHMLSAELAGAYKPNPAMYRLAIEKLHLPPEQILMVASHNYDLDAAKEHGFKTAFVSSPSDPGQPNPSYDFNAADFTELAEKIQTGVAL